jgi:8-oxo-dGTP pyrophosphatase MutT (NUDIX family)
VNGGRRPIRTGDVRAVLQRRGPGRPSAIDFDGARRSAVLAALFDHDDEAHVLLTRRTRRLRNHKGEVSFPGGRLDEGETAVEAALREAHEEVALEPSGVEIVGELDEINTWVSRSLITPLVGLLPGPPTGLVPNPHEVDRIFAVPLSVLTADGVFHEERWGQPGMDRPINFFHLDGETIWGATGTMLRQLLTLVYS